MPSNRDLLHAFIERVWNRADLSGIDDLVGEQYTVHSDPGDPWEGQTLTRDGLKERIALSRAPFPDLAFEIDETVADGDQVVISWIMRGTQTGSMGALAPTGRRIGVRGMTIYRCQSGRITGHRQVVDRLGVAQQLGLLG